MEQERDIFLIIREQFETEEEYKEYIANIFLKNADALFGQMLGFLCEKSLLSLREIGRRSKAYREKLKKEGRLRTESSTGAVDHSSLSRIINASSDKIVSYGQIIVWFHVLKERFNDDGYKLTCEMIEEKPFIFTQEFEDEMWYLAKYAPPRKVVEAYKEHEGIIY